MRSVLLEFEGFVNAVVVDDDDDDDDGNGDFILVVVFVLSLFSLSLARS